MDIADKALHRFHINKGRLVLIRDVWVGGQHSIYFGRPSQNGGYGGEDSFGDIYGAIEWVLVEEGFDFDPERVFCKASEPNWMEPEERKSRERWTRVAKTKLAYFED